MLKHITRRKQNFQVTQKQSWLDPTKHGAETELERLKNDQTTLQTEVLKLRQQQETTQSYLAAIEERLRVTEMKQRHMALFLMKFLKNPLVLQRISEKMRKIRAISSGEVLKKRRLASPDMEDGGMLMEAMEAAGIYETENARVDYMRVQLQEKLRGIQSDIEALLCCDETGSPAQESEMSSESFLLWDKLMEDDMIYEDGTTAASEQQCDMVSESKASECGTQMRGTVGLVECLASIA